VERNERISRIPRGRFLGGEITDFFGSQRSHQFLARRGETRRDEHFTCITRSKKSPVSKRKSALGKRKREAEKEREREWEWEGEGGTDWGNGTPRRCARRTRRVCLPRLVSPRLALPRLASRRLASPRLAPPRARTPLRSRSQSARLTFFLHVLFPRLYPVSRANRSRRRPRRIAIADRKGGSNARERDGHVARAFRGDGDGGGGGFPRNRKWHAIRDSKFHSNEIFPPALILSLSFSALLLPSRTAPLCPGAHPLSRALDFRRKREGEGRECAWLSVAIYSYIII